MKFGLTLKAGGLLETLNLSLARVEDLAKPLKEIGKEKRAEVKEIFDTEGDGQWPAWAASTVERREHTGTGKVLMRGGSRAGYVRFLQSQEKGIATHMARKGKENLEAHPILGRLGITKAKASPKMARMQQRLTAARAKLDQISQKAEAQISEDRRIRGDLRKLQQGSHAMQKTLANNPEPAKAKKLQAKIEENKQKIAKLRPKIARAARRDIRRRGKAASTKKRRMLGKIGQSIGAEVYIDSGKYGGFLVILPRLNDKSKILGKVHDQGDGHVPMRKYLELTPKNVARIKEILISHCLAPLQGRM